MSVRWEEAKCSPTEEVVANAEGSEEINKEPPLEDVWDPENAAEVPLKAEHEFLFDVGRVEPCHRLKLIEFLQNTSFLGLLDVDSS
ncbi:hypothetical protein Q3G72_030236 [Acer saccharum]|nr:hypothetical protein Q3G72_030236 [Acer saccharum]